MILRLTKWIIFVLGAALVIAPNSSLQSLLVRYHLDIDQAELAAKFYNRGISDKLEWAIAGISLISLAMIIGEIQSLRRKEREHAPPAGRGEAPRP